MDPPSSPSDLSGQELQFILKHDLTSFIERSFYELYPGRPFHLAPFIEVIATKLEALRRGEIRRLIINLPPRHLKSHCVSVAFVAWLLGQAPAQQVICASHSQDLADEFGAACQRLMASSFYRALFGDLLRSGQATRDILTVAGGRRLATAVGSALTGRGADVFVLDDPHGPDEGLSGASRKATHKWFDHELVNRLNIKTTGKIIIVMQRLHVDDLVGHLLTKEQWDVMALPAIAEVDECHLIEGPLGWRYFKRSPGDLLNSTRESAESLAYLRRSISEFAFAGQYQQNPISSERARAIEAERDRRLLEAYESGDQLTLGRLWHSRMTATPEGEITDEQAMHSYEEYTAIVEILEREI